MANALPTALQGGLLSTPWRADLLELLDVPFDFSPQPDPIPAALRPERRIPLTLLLVAKSHGSGVNWKGLQVLNWAIRDSQHMDLLISLLNGSDIPDRPVVRFEPALDRTIDLAVGLGLLTQKPSRAFQLTPSGRQVVEQLEQSNAFVSERQLLARLRRKLTQKDVSRVLEWRSS